MTPELARTLLSRMDGNHSVLYPILKKEIATYHYQPEELPYPNEFLFFEDDYLQYYLDICQRKIPSHTVLDVGCQYGFQSHIFEDFNYIGVDCCPHRWFRDKGNYIQDYFWNLNMGLSDKIVISNMSLGYFNEWGDGITNETLAKQLSQCKWLYISTTPELLALLKPHFRTYKVFRNGEFSKVFLGKQEDT